jgi:hypothetical protein
MLIKNRNLAHTDLNLPGKITVRGDAAGVFDVPDEVGKMLCRTPGWEEHRGAQGPVSRAPAAPVAPPKLATKKVENASAVAQEPQSLGSATVLKTHVPNPPPIVVPEPEAAPSAPTEEEEGPDLDKLNKEQLLAVAKEYGVEVSERWGEKRLRAVLDKELYGEGDGGSEDDASETDAKE